MRWRRVLSSRFFIVPTVIVVAVIGWNLYVMQHDHGLLQGHVVDASGHPVDGATVILFAHDFVTQVEKARTRTDASGAFHFDNNDSHRVQLQAQDGNARSRRITIRLWFRAQDRLLQKPLRLAPSA